MGEVGEYSINLTEIKGFQKGQMGVGYSVGCLRGAENVSAPIYGSSTFNDFLLLSSLDSKRPLRECDSILHSGKCTSPKEQSYSFSPPIAFLEHQVSNWVLMCFNSLLRTTTRATHSLDQKM